MELIQAIGVGLCLSDTFFVPHLGANYIATNVLLIQEQNYSEAGWFAQSKIKYVVMIQVVTRTIKPMVCFCATDNDLNNLITVVTKLSRPTI